MDTTLEIRWFGRGSPPDVLEPRSDATGAGSPEDRTDTYLWLPGTDDLGIKLRSGGRSFEVKLCQRGYGETRFPGAPAGNLEAWQKCRSR